MHITIATGLYPPEIGGPATYAKLLEENLPAKGIEVVVVPFGWVRHYPKIIRHMVFAYKLWQESRQADIIYALDPTSVGLPALLVARLRKKPFLIRLGGDYAWEQGCVRFGVKDTLDDFIDKKSPWPMPVKILAKLQTFVVLRAQKVIVPSEYLKTIVMRWGILEEKINVIYSALYPLSAPGSKEEIRSQLNYTYPTIVSAGRLVPWKGFLALLDSFAEVIKNYPSATLVIVGDGEEKAKLEQRAEVLNITKQVRFAGRVSKDALGATIKGADMFVLNTAYEGLSHQLIEAMDLGTPVVSTAVGGNPELIADGVHGLLVEFDDVPALVDAITFLLEHKAEKELMISSAQERTKLFSQTGVLNEVEAVFKDLLTETKK
jgi:glycosyltransferase involved in cell wall biosynthesis